MPPYLQQYIRFILRSKYLRGQPVLDELDEALEQARDEAGVLGGVHDLHVLAEVRGHLAGSERRQKAAFAFVGSRTSVINSGKRTAVMPYTAVTALLASGREEAEGVSCFLQRFFEHTQKQREETKGFESTPTP